MTYLVHIRACFEKTLWTRFSWWENGQRSFDKEVVPWCKSKGFKLLVMDNESKFHTKILVTHMRSKGIEIYPGSGKKPWDRAKNDYPPRRNDGPWWCGRMRSMNNGKSGLTRPLGKWLIANLKSLGRSLTPMVVERHTEHWTRGVRTSHIIWINQLKT